MAAFTRLYSWLDEFPVPVVAVAMAAVVVYEHLAEERQAPAPNAGMTSRANSSTERMAAPPEMPGRCIQQITSVAPSWSRSFATSAMKP